MSDGVVEGVVKGGLVIVAETAGVEPVASLLAAAIRTFIPDNTKQFREALVDELHSDVYTLRDTIARLETRVDDEVLGAFRVLKERLGTLEGELKAHKLKLEEFTAAEGTQLAKQFVEAWAQAYGERQREAILNATVALFDPRRGDKGRRRFWMTLAAQLTNEELAALELFEQHTPSVLVTRNEGRVGIRHSNGSTAEAKPEDAMPLMTGMLALAERGLLRDASPGDSVRTYFPTAGIKVLLSYI